MNINGFSEEKVISLLRFGLDLAGDGGISPWCDGEYEACQKYLDMLESKLGIKNTVECYECDKIVHYTDEDIENGYVVCPCCGTKLILLD